MTRTLTYAGPKRGLVDMGPGPWDRWPRNMKRSTRARRFFERHLIVPKGYGAGKPFVLHPFQVSLLQWWLDGPLRASGVGLSRGNGKTGLCAGLGLAGAFAFGEAGAQIPFVTVSERIAMLLLSPALSMVKASPELSGRSQWFSSDRRLEIPATESMITALPADVDKLQGYDPLIAVVDEFGFVGFDVWEAMTGAMGKRAWSLVLGIGAPGYDKGVMWDLRERARRGELPATVGWREWMADPGCAIYDRAQWAKANPALVAGFLAPDALEAAAATMREASFRALRLGQWVGREDSWMDPGQWTELPELGAPARGVPRVLGFDGSASGDSTALIGAPLGGNHVWVVGHWENPGDKRWRVPRREVIDTIRTELDAGDVVHVAYDPWGWRTEFEDLEASYPRVVFEQFPTNVLSRMGPATDRFYQAVNDGIMFHDHHPALAAHIGNCVAIRTPAGDVVRKDAKSSTRKIDLAIAAIVANHAAAYAEAPVAPVNPRNLLW